LDGIKIAFVRVGQVNLKLIQSVADGRVIGKFIAKRGEGVHHIAYELEDVSSALEDLKAQGVELVDEAPRRVAHGKEVAFVDPKSSHGVLTELVCKKRRMQNA
jgi:methylmalonyl-CoA/ethylmalonyl-CoA epimerase